VTQTDGAAPVVRRADQRGIATLVLDSPANRNALSSALVGQLSDHLHAIESDDAVRAVVLTHTGSTFCAGADLAEAAREGGPAQGTARIVRALRHVLDLPKPVVARIDGHVRAGGLGLVGACDIALAGPGSTFAFTEVRLGLAPAIISLTVLDRMHDRDAVRYFLTGEQFDATEAARTGLITEAADDLDAAVGRVVDAFRQCSPQGLAETKALTTRAVLEAYDRHAEHLAEESARLFASEDGQEGIAAFREKRPPRWAL
jgi:enoyl-CoA hydratase